jgi:DNA-binding response OmpR family regulator
VVDSPAVEPRDDTRGDVLIVDDNPAHLDLLGQMLRGQGYRVRAVVDGERALKAAHACAPEVIMLDVNMPGMDGFEVCRRLKQDPALSRIPVLFVSAADDVLDKVAAFEAGAADYVTKPYEFPEVLNRVGLHRERVQLERRLAALTAELGAAQDRVRELEARLASASPR